ncbi:hypothetical protein, partial [Immundisolibacter sp.]|uniref:hypothetical protein n=1 Tax=Immundisolibacter sp. TaxID=1934948 RepID=UPI003564542B
LDRHAGVGFTQEANDLLFGKPLLHVQSPGQVGLDSKSPCYSKPGGRRPSRYNPRALKEHLEVTKPLSTSMAQAEGRPATIFQACNDQRAALGIRQPHSIHVAGRSPGEARTLHP